MIQRRFFQVIVGFFLALVSVPWIYAQEVPLKAFDDYVNKALRDWEVPGLAIVIIKNDTVVLQKGYGVRKLGEPAPVDERTLFAIGSASKAFTAASLAMLVEEGKIKWDDPAAKHLSGFQLYDPYVTHELTVRDLLCHRSGLERGDLLWYGSAYDRNEILRRVRYLKPTWSFRSQFGYQNIMYLAAGQIIPAVTGKSWDDFVRQRILTPLGMRDTSTSVAALRNTANVATPHGKLDDKLEPLDWRNIDNVGPAGSINSNVVDMAQWVRLQLGEGVYQSNRLLSSGSIKEMHMPHTVIRLEGVREKLNPETRFMTYGLGWFLQDYRGRKVVQHGGNIDGMSALVAMIPEEKLGVVILTNRDSTSLPTAIMYKVFDIASSNAPARDWSAELLKAVKGAEEQAKAAEKKTEAERVQGTAPSLPLAKYVGSFKNDMYGETKVAQENGKLVLNFGPAYVGDLEHWHFDTFRARWRDRRLTKTLVTFTLNAQGQADEVKINVPNVSDLVFKRAPETAEATPGLSLSEKDLRKFTGKYAMAAPPIEVSIEMIGDTLKAVVPGQPVYTLVPLTPVRFRIDGAPAGYFAQFELSDGKVKSLTVEQGPRPSLVLLPKP